MADSELTKPPTGAKTGTKRPKSKLGCFGAIYVAGFLFTTLWYAITLFDGTCDARSLRGRCLDGSIFEILIYALIWPLHWLFELLEALGV